MREQKVQRSRVLKAFQCSESLAIKEFQNS